MRTIEVLPGGLILAYCHGSSRERTAIEAIA
jgi:hypothetical protein